MSIDQDTIVAISTPSGRGGIGIVRLSGPQARTIAEPLLRLRRPMAHAQARLAQILDLTTGEAFDEAVVTLFVAPHSYTSEDVVEIACHGSPVLLQHLVRTSIASGARLAEPGEFTQRAFLSGRIDLTQAEAVHDLVASSTLHQARIAAAQLGGSLARAIDPAKQRLIHLIASLEAGIDFAEDDIDLLTPEEIIKQVEGIQLQLEALAASYSYGRIVRDGFTLAIVGRPNAGKSSLFNRLLARDRAIVTAHPGTTRDPISERLDLAGIPVELIDTAGLRDAPTGSEGDAEREGILRSRSTMAEADLVLHLLDATTLHAPSLHPDDLHTLQSMKNRTYLVVINKIDLVPLPAKIAGLDPPPIQVSTKTGDGMDILRDAIFARLAQVPPTADSAVITSLRQHQALAESLAALQQAHDGTLRYVPHEFLLLDLYNSLTALGTLTGVTTPDDILKLIFSTFCIGK